MNPVIENKFQQAKQLANRADQYCQQGNYQYACKCYSNVSGLLKALAKEASKPETVQALKHKIKKYDDRAAQMLVKQKQKAKKSTIKSFGFPEVPKPTITTRLQTKKTEQQAGKKQVERKKTQVDNEVAGLVAKDIKTSFADIVGMTELKQILYEAVIIPQKRPDLFQGIRAPPRGILLYGPPGNGKTYITKALAKQSGCTFYGLSAGSIVNKFVGESEKMLKKVFDSAKNSSPSIVFIDEIDSMLTARSESDNDSTRRLKTQFLVQFDNLENSGVLLIGATNLPNQLDLAALRRFNKLVYVGLPDKEARKGIVDKTLEGIKSEISSSEMGKIVKDLDGYSASEITDIVKQASMMPLREISKKSLETVDANKIRPVKFDDFSKVIKAKRPLLSKQDLKKYEGKFK